MSERGESKGNENEWNVSPKGSNNSINLKALKIFDNDEVQHMGKRNSRVYAQEYLELMEKEGPALRRRSTDARAETKAPSNILERNNSDVLVALAYPLGRKNNKYPSTSSNIKSSTSNPTSKNSLSSSKAEVNEPYLGDKSDASNYSLENTSLSVDSKNKSQKSSPMATRRRPIGVGKSAKNEQIVERALEILESDKKKQTIPEGGIVVCGDSEIPIEPIEAKIEHAEEIKEKRLSSFVKWIKKIF